jgi:transcription initiation factor IIE alpha subunit
VLQKSQTDSPDNLICLRCRVAMSVTCASEEYPGYQRRVFECPICDETMTQWAGVSLASSSAETGESLGLTQETPL